MELPPGPRDNRLNAGPALVVETETIPGEHSPGPATGFLRRDRGPHLESARAMRTPSWGPMEIPPLPPATILLVEVGSTAHGTGPPGGEDQEETAVTVESAEEVLGLDPGGPATVMHRTQPEGVRSGPGDVDRTIHPLRRFLYLAITGNPSILMSFWAPVIDSTPEGRELQELGELFIGRHIIPRYRGYMQSQAARLLGIGSGRHGRRGGGQREELIQAFGYDTKYAMHCARLGFQGLELLQTVRLNLPMQGEPAEWLRAVRRGEVPFDAWWNRALALDAELEPSGCRPGTDETEARLARPLQPRR